jgi:hypothetical protein
MVYRRLSERKADQDRTLLQRAWMTLVEAIEFIERADRESGMDVRQSPFEQICDAIDDGELRACWVDKAQPPRDGSGMLWTPDDPFLFIGYGRKKTFRLENGGEIHWRGRRWRKLLLSREDMGIFANGGPDNKTIKQLSLNDEGKKAIHEAIMAVYDLATQQGIKPPNKVEMRKLAQRWLEERRSVTAKALWIEQLLADARYNSRRGKAGATIKGCLLPVSQLRI